MNDLIALGMFFGLGSERLSYFVYQNSIFSIRGKIAANLFQRHSGHVNSIASTDKRAPGITHNRKSQRVTCDIMAWITDRQLDALKRRELSAGGVEGSPIDGSSFDMPIPIQGLFETHLTVENLDRSVEFYSEVLKLRLAGRFVERRCAFFWVGPDRDAMLGLWEIGNGPQRMQLHTAFRVDLEHLLIACERLRQTGLVPLDFAGKPTKEPVVLCWMPAAAVYFNDPDGHSLEFLAMLPVAPRSDLPICSWSDWSRLTATR